MLRYSDVRFPLKAVNVMHTVALRTEASLPVRTSAIRTTAYKVLPHIPRIRNVTYGSLLICLSVNTGSHGPDVCFSCFYNGEYAEHTDHCVHENWIHGSPSESLPPFLNNFRLHKPVRVCLPVIQKMSTFNQTYWVLIDMFVSYPFRRRIMQRLALYQGVMPIYMDFSDDAEDTYARSLKLLQVH